MTAIQVQDHTTVCATTYQSTPLGYAQLTVTGTAATLDALLAAASVPLARPPQARMMLVSVETNAIRWLDDGQVPTATYGQPIAAAADVALTTNFAQLQLIAQSGSATVNVSFYR